MEYYSKRVTDIIYKSEILHFVLESSLSPKAKRRTNLPRTNFCGYAGFLEI